MSLVERDELSVRPVVVDTVGPATPTTDRLVPAAADPPNDGRMYALFWIPETRTQEWVAVDGTGTIISGYGNNYGNDYGGPP